MVALRSTRQDRTLLVAVWVLTVIVLGFGIAMVNPVLLLWGAVGLPGAIFLTRIHLRDTRKAAPPADDTSEPADADADNGADTNTNTKESGR